MFYAKYVLRKLKAMKMRGIVRKAVEWRRAPVATKKASWMGISHGYYAVERDNDSEGSSSRSVIAQREQVGDSEIWFFGAFDQFMGDVAMAYLQSRLFDTGISEDRLWTRAKRVLKKAFALAKPNDHVGRESSGGSTAALVLNSEKFIAADIGQYRAVVCRGGVASRIGGRRQRLDENKWFLKTLLTGTKFGRAANNGDHKPKKSGLVIVSEKVESETEFIILASDGVWEVMRDQEAVDLIWHIEDAQEAAECLAKEALNRMSKSSISCVVIRFG